MAGVLAQGRGPAAAQFQTSDRCVACHNGLQTASGDDVSIGFDWRASTMANSSRDPYWQASVRRETIDHPSAKAEIEDECATCHMPITRYEAKQRGGHGQVFAHLPFDLRHPAGPPGRRRRVLFGMPPDRQGAPRHARKLQRWIRRRSAVSSGRASGVRPVRSRGGTPAHHEQFVGGLPADAVGAHPAV